MISGDLCADVDWLSLRLDLAVACLAAFWRQKIRDLCNDQIIDICAVSVIQSSFHWAGQRRATHMSIIARAARVPIKFTSSLLPDHC